MSDSKRSKGGRPTLPESKRVKNVITFKVNNDDLEQLKRYTRKAKKSQADVIRGILFNKNLTIRVMNEADSKIVLKIDQLFEEYKNTSEELKKIKAKSDKAKDEELRDIIDDELNQALLKQELFKQMLYEINDLLKNNRRTFNVKAKDLK